MAGDCTPNCPTGTAFLTYLPSVPGNAFVLAAFALLVPLTFFLGIRFRTPVFSAVLATGLLLELMGFAGRLMLHADVASQTAFGLFLLGTVLGPTLVSTALFDLLPHVFRLYGKEASALRPVYVAFFFGALALLAFVLQLVGVIFVSFGASGAEV